MPTTLEIKQQQLAEVRAAITKVVTHGRSYMVMDGGAQRQLVRSNLAELRDMERQLETEIARIEGGGIRVNYGLPQ